MSALSAKAREIAEAFIHDNEIMADSETQKMRDELAALIDAHLKDVREAMQAAEGDVEFESDDDVIERYQIALASLTPEDRE